MLTFLSHSLVDFLVIESRVIALFRFLNRSEWGLRFWVWVFSCGDFLIPVVAIVVLEVLGIFFCVCVCGCLGLDFSLRSRGFIVLGEDGENSRR